VRSLLRHSSGLPCEADHTVWEDRARLFPDWDELLARAGHLELAYPVDTKHNYSNLGYFLLGEIVATVSGLSYEDYVRQRLLDPLDMQDTTLFPPAERIRTRLATGYSHRLRGPEPRVALADDEPGAFAPAGGYYSSVLDMAKFAMWQFRVRDGEDDRILGSSSLDEMQSVQWPDPRWGLGFTGYWIGDLDLYGHQGGCAQSGFKAQFILCPEEKTAVVVMFNASDGPQFAVAFSTYEIMSEALRNPGDGGGESNTWSQYAGYFAAAGAWSDAEVVEWDDGLAVLWVPNLYPVNALVKLQHVEDGLFRQVDGAGNLGKHYAFAVDGAGDVRMRFNNNLLRRTSR
jgi:CubicO group peptidase (beta-lactamase class C family)